MRLAKTTIGARIFGAFVIMSALIGVMGLAGYGVLSAAGRIAINTFDGPLMAINYARAAQYDFAEMKRAELRFTAYTLQPGQAVLFSGSSQWHYRDPMPPGAGRRFCDLLFLHYVPAGTRDASRPQAWAQLFGEAAFEGLGGPMDDFI